MIVPITKLANFLAKYSCPKWNGANATNKISELMHKILRRLCRYLLWSLVNVDYWLFAPSSPLKVPRSDNRAKFGNTYPRVFRMITDWTEDIGALVVDRANFVIKYATSYCAWKIYELTGKWPTNPVPITDAEEYAKRERKHDAKYWLEFLQAQDSFVGVVETPHFLRHYIGINADYGEYGLVVWFEELVYSLFPNDPPMAWVSTYENKQYIRTNVLLSDFYPDEVGKKAVYK